MSVLNNILDTLVLDQQSAALTIGGNALTIVKRKLPKKEETVDSAYQVNVYAEPISENVQRIARGKYLVKYYVSVTLVTPNDRDAALNLADHIAWRETTRGRYETGFADLGRMDIRDSVFLDRNMLAEGYDYQTIALVIWSYESR